VHSTVSIDSREAGRREIGEERPLQVVPGRDAATLLVVAEAGIDDDAPARRFDDERVDAHFQAAALVGEVRPQPRDRQDFLIGRLRQQKPAAAGYLQFDDLRYRHIAHAPLHCRSPPSLPSAG
jgi:hypothetical protein